jgi:3-polyprenyl-4-hydroxybenzoate decarboxylase
MKWVRSARAAVVELGDDVLLVAGDGVVRKLDGDSAGLAREVIAFYGEPHTAEDTYAHLEAIAGPLGERRAVVAQLLDLLAQTGVLAHALEPAAHAPAHVVVGVTGAIAATHAPALVAALLARGHAVEVALTPTAARFVSCDALAAIAHREPHTTMFPRAAHHPAPHVALAAWAELVIVYPATGTTIARLAGGDFSELVAATALTTAAPVVIVPSMNAEMLAAPAVQRNLERLRGDGFAIVGGVPSREAAVAPQARGELLGAAPPPGEVVATIEALRAAGVLRGRKAPPALADDRDDEMFAALAARAPAPCRVLDVGCGLGAFARRCAEAGYRVVATDSSDIALDLARERGGDVVYVRDLASLVGPFDVIAIHARPASAHVLQRLAAQRTIFLVHGTYEVSGFEVVSL